MDRKKLIVNADDFGQSHGINSGIIQAFTHGIVTSTSLMVRYPATNEAVQYAMKNPDLGVGLHIDLGEWILYNGNWDAVYEVVSLENKEEVKAEINKQLESFYRIMGRNPTHLDSHQHVHRIKSIRQIFVETAEDLEIPLRECSQKVKYCGAFYGQSSDGLTYTDPISVAGLIRILKQLSDGTTELACHPGSGKDINTMYNAERLTELTTLCDRRIKDTIEDLNIELCSFREI
jgi:chitin disaccharide deacetylase